MLLSGLTLTTLTTNLGGCSIQVDRLAEVLEALDTDEAGDALHYSCLFNDDDEFNQGMTAEIIRSQHLAERLEFLQVRSGLPLFCQQPFTDHGIV